MSKKKKKKAEEISIPITPMLDMAFQLLTFFILTYHPAPSEGQFSMNLLPAAPATDPGEAKESDTPTTADIPASLRTLPTVLRASEGGVLGRVTVATKDVNGMAELKTELESILKDPSFAFDQTVLKVDANLKYSELMQVIDVFSSLKINKISFSELGPNDMN